MKLSLTDDISTLPQISVNYSKLLNRLGIFTIKDLLTYFPREYKDNTEVSTVEQIKDFDNADKNFQLKVIIRKFKNSRLRKGRSMQTAIVEDESDSIECKWFNQPYLEKTLLIDKEFFLQGKLKLNNGKFEFFPSLYEPIIEGRDSVHLNRITPEYALTEGVSKKWFRNRMKYLIDNISLFEVNDELSENNPGSVSLKILLNQIHFPENTSSFFDALEELSIYELTEVQLNLMKKRESKKVYTAPQIKSFSKDIEIINKFIRNLPFELTKDQSNAVTVLINKLREEQPIDALIQGDVGSGKTIIALIMAFIIALEGYQSIILAPTTILAKQHFDNFKKLLEPYNLKIILASSDNKKKETGDIIIGTTAILARKDIIINKPGIIIVDEQHKFGVTQREELIKEYSDLFEGFFPHFINMTATPIPRSIVQVFFGDLDVIQIKEKPKNRIPIKTLIVPELKRNECMEWIKSNINAGGQAYWVCPLVTESTLSDKISVESKYKELKDYYKDLNIDFLHGKMKDKEKQQITADFANNKSDILVSTTVIEVGIDVANATIIAIEDADKFGLAQLHQIRGRVGRGTKESWCILFPSKNITPTGLKRIKFLAEHIDGLEIAEFDLKTRGPGEIYGVIQSGLPNLKIADLSREDLIKKSRNLAEKLYQKGVKSIEIFSKQ
jgi:ATP-dependent DNA helicase RecG